MNESTALMNAMSHIQGSIVSDNMRVLAQNDFDARKIANHLGNDYNGADFTTLADLVVCEMDKMAITFPSHTMMLFALSMIKKTKLML